MVIVSSVMLTCFCYLHFWNLRFDFQLRDWLHDKMAAAQDETYRDAKNLHSKYLRHQAFEREIAANKERLQRLMQVRLVSTFQKKNYLFINDLLCYM